MTENRSLDDLVGGGADGDDSTDESADASDDAAPAVSESDDGPDTDADTAPTTESVEPAVGTYRWDPEGVACADCGETVERLWLDDGGQVCEACKEW